MRLRDVQIDDVDAYVQMRCDPVMMAHLGGPRRPEDMAQKVKRDAAEVAGGRALIYMIVVDGLRADQVAGTVTLSTSPRLSEIVVGARVARRGSFAGRYRHAAGPRRTEMGRRARLPIDREHSLERDLCPSLRPGSPSPALSTWHSAGQQFRSNDWWFDPQANPPDALRSEPPGALRLLPALPLVGRA